MHYSCYAKFGVAGRARPGELFKMLAVLYIFFLRQEPDPGTPFGKKIFLIGLFDFAWSTPTLNHFLICETEINVLLLKIGISTWHEKKFLV